MKKFLLVNSTTSNSKTSTATIYGHKHMIVEGGGSIVSDAVMNNILYPREFVEKLATNTKEIPAPFSHPSDDDGNFVLAESVRALVQNWGGVHARNWRMDSDRLVRDIAIDIDSFPSKNKDELIRRIENGEDCDTSTGLILELKEESGVGKDGESYDYVAVNGYLNHDAILLNEVGAATNLMGVGVTANTNEENLDVVVYECNASMPAMNLPLAPLDTEWDSSAADKLIREFTESGDEPSSTYRRYFLYFDREKVKEYGAYKLPFATIIDGRPHAVLNAINNASSRLDQTQGLSDDDKARAKRVIEAYQNKAEAMKKSDASNSKGMFAKAWNSIKSMFKGNELSHDQVYSAIRDELCKGLPENECYRRWPCDIYSSHFIYHDRTDDGEKYFKQGYHVTSDNKVEFDGEPSEVVRTIEYKTVTNGDSAMREQILAVLNAAGVKTDGLGDDALLAAYNEQMKKAQESGSDEEQDKKDKTATNSAEVPEWFKPFADQLTAMNASEATKLEDAAKKVAALNSAVTMGINEEDAKNLGLKWCENFLAKNSGVVNFAGVPAGFQANSQSKEDDFDMTKLGGAE